MSGGAGLAEAASHHLAAPALAALGRAPTQVDWKRDSGLARDLQKV